MAITDRSLASLPVPETGQKLYPDGTVLGLYVRVSQGGTRTFVLVQGKSRRFHTIGRYGIVKLAEAREAARRIVAERTLGRIIPAAISLDTARQQYLAEKSIRANTRIYTERNLARLDASKVADITPSLLMAILDKLSPSSRAQALAVYRAFFNWCVKRHYLDASPAERMTARPSTPRARVLTDEELGRIWRACEQRSALASWKSSEHEEEAKDQAGASPEGRALPANFAAIVQLLILTGQRRGEIAALQTSWIKHDTITLPSHVAKNGREHVLPVGTMATRLLCTSAAALSKHAIRQNSHELLFPASTGSSGKISVFSGWSKSKSALDNASGVTGWTLHDLRRTFATIHARIGTPLPVIEKLLNHISGSFGGIVSVYQRHSFMDEMRTAQEHYEAHLARLFSPSAM